MDFVLKAALSGVIVAVVATVSRRYPAAGALIASLPLISVLGMVWLWIETRDAATMEAHVTATFWYVIPSLPMFLAIPALMRAGVPFYRALGLGLGLTMALYAGVAAVAARFGVRL